MDEKENTPSAMGEDVEEIVRMIRQFSPDFRGEFAMKEADTIDFFNHLKAFLKVSRQCAQMGNVFAEVEEKVSAEISNFTERNLAEDQEHNIYQDAMIGFCDVFRDLSVLNSTLMQNLDALFSDPLRLFFEVEQKNLREKRKVLDKAMDDFEHSHQNMMAKSKAASTFQTFRTFTKSYLEENPKAPTLESERMQLEDNLNDAKKELNKSLFDYYMAMYDVQKKKNYEFLERLCAFMFSQLAYFHQGYDLMRELEPMMRNLGSEIQTVRTNIQMEGELVKTKQEEIMNSVDPFLPLPKGMKQGHLSKRSTNMRKDWKKRWFLCAHGHLSYYRSYLDMEQLGDLDLSTCIVRTQEKDTENTGKGFLFHIISPTRRMNLQAATLEEMASWIEVLNENIQRQLTMGSGVLSVTKSQKTFKDELYEMDELNETCSDCNARNPTWASINIGVLLCIKCAGIHRSLGVQISKVRSLDLDTFDENMQQIFRELGNDRVNSVLEGYLPDNLDRPTTSSTLEEREEFIIRKHVAKAFVHEPGKISEIRKMNEELLSAAEAGNVLALSFALFKGADGNAQDSAGNTALHLAVQNKDIMIAEHLLNQEVKVNIKNNEGETALMLSARGDLPGFCTLLLRRGARTNLRNAADMAAHDIATSSGNLRCSEIIEQYAHGHSVGIWNDDTGISKDTYMQRQNEQEQAQNALEQGDLPVGPGGRVLRAPPIPPRKSTR